MHRVMLVGECGAGKSTLIRALSGEAYAPRRLMAVEYWGRFINTPGEFLENRRFYAALITTAADSHTILLVQDATRTSSLLPPQLAPVFNRRVLGVVSKAHAHNARVDKAQRFLHSAGVRDFYITDALSGTGIEALKSVLGLESSSLS